MSRIVLIGCECSGVVRQEFRKLGHDTVSCDLQAAEDGSVHHIAGDVLTILHHHWDLAIFHPPCTYLCSSGLHWNGRVTGRQKKTEAALKFVRKLLDAPIERIALENPVGCISTRIRPYDQRVQPYQFGEDASKGTCLWLKNLPPLTGTKFIDPRMVCPCGHVFPFKILWRCPQCGSGKAKPRWANQTDSGQNKLGPSETRGQDRARTYPGIAKAMAEQWGALLQVLK